MVRRKERNSSPKCLLIAVLVLVTLIFGLRAESVDFDISGSFGMLTGTLDYFRAGNKTVHQNPVQLSCVNQSFALLVQSYSGYRDVWPIAYKTLDIFYIGPARAAGLDPVVYLCVDKSPAELNQTVPRWLNVLVYKPAQPNHWYSKAISCAAQIKEEHVLVTQEDMLLVGPANWQNLNRACDIVSSKHTDTSHNVAGVKQPQFGSVTLVVWYPVFWRSMPWAQGYKPFARYMHEQYLVVQPTVYRRSMYLEALQLAGNCLPAGQKRSGPLDIELSTNHASCFRNSSFAQTELWRNRLNGFYNITLPRDFLHVSFNPVRMTAFPAINLIRTGQYFTGQNLEGCCLLRDIYGDQGVFNQYPSHFSGRDVKSGPDLLQELNITLPSAVERISAALRDCQHKEKTLTALMVTPAFARVYPWCIKADPGANTNHFQNKWPAIFAAFKLHQQQQQQQHQDASQKLGKDPFFVASSANSPLRSAAERTSIKENSILLDQLYSFVYGSENTESFVDSISHRTAATLGIQLDSSELPQYPDGPPVSSVAAG
mmetsp:Transcript_9254/g.17629  ORF Transcript_9254/g.17629 Transcript_9254/m.17629 type:complete len:542 (-) Transcript_9254:190-1815(-)